MIYLHVGYPKAASSTIQRFLAANAEQLAAYGLVYPRLSETREDAFGASTDAHNALAVELRRGAPGAAWRRLEAIAGRLQKDQDLLLSAEALTAVKPEPLRAALGGHKVTIIAYVREFSKLIVSLYAQLTKTGASSVDFDAFLERRLDRTYFSLTEHFSEWARVFGAGNIKVRLLNSRVLEGGDIRLDILEAAGLDVDAVAPGVLTMTADANSSPGWKTLEIVRDLNRSLAEQMVAANGKAALQEARKVRRKRTGSPLFDFAAFLSQPASAVGQSLGFVERGNYLTSVQLERCHAEFDAHIDALNAMGMDTRLPRASREGFVPRAFMPAIEHVPPEEAFEFMRRLAPMGWWSLISGERRLAPLLRGARWRQESEAAEADTAVRDGAAARAERRKLKKMKRAAAVAAKAAAPAADAAFAQRKRA